MPRVRNDTVRVVGPAAVPMFDEGNRAFAIENPRGMHQDE